MKIGKNRKKMNIKGALILSNLVGDRLTYTIEDGTNKFILINKESLDKLHFIVQKIWDSFDWIGFDFF